MEQPERHEETDKFERLISSEGDESLVNVEYFLHGTNSLSDAQKVQSEGLSVREGRATVSTDLAHALRWAMGEKRQFSESKTLRSKDEIGKIFVIKKPSNFRVDYGLFTDAVIMGDEITGFPLKYASGRKQLAFYRDDSSKVNLGRKTKDERVWLTIPAKQIELVITPTKELAEFVDTLSKKTKKLEAIDINNTSKELAGILGTQQTRETPDNLSHISRQLVVTTIESIVISKLRNVYLDVLASKGYKIFENGQQQERTRDLNSLKLEIAELYNKSHEGGFDIGVGWLNELTKAKTEFLDKELS
jgi:hypothetical protein